MSDDNYIDITKSLLSKFNTCLISSFFVYFLRLSLDIPCPVKKFNKIIQFKQMEERFFIRWKSLSFPYIKKYQMPDFAIRQRIHIVRTVNKNSCDAIEVTYPYCAHF